MERSLSHCRRIAAFVSGLFVLTTLGAVPAARAGIGDSPLPSFSDNTPSVTVLRVPGVINRTGTATVFLCSSVDSANVHIGVEVFDDAGVLQNDVHAGAGAVLNVAPGATVTISTSGTGAFLESAIVTVSAFFAQGSARVVASSSKVHCNAAMRAKDGSRILIYLSSPTTVFLHLDKIEAKSARATWISPVTGEKKPAGTHATGNHTGATFPSALTQFFKTPDFWEDAVLLLEAVEEQTSKQP